MHVMLVTVGRLFNFRETFVMNSSDFAIASDSIRFNTPISISLALDDQRICDRSIVPFVKIKRIVVHVERYVVFHIYRAAEEFESVVVGRICLSILDNSSVAHTTKGDSVQFVAISNLIAF